MTIETVKILTGNKHALINRINFLHDQNTVCPL